MAVINIHDVNINKVEKHVACPACDKPMLKQSSSKHLLRKMLAIFKPNQPVVVYYCPSCEKEHVLI